MTWSMPARSAAPTRRSEILRRSTDRCTPIDARGLRVLSPDDVSVSLEACPHHTQGRRAVDACARGAAAVKEWGRALGTLVAVVIAGALLWYVPHFNRWTTGGYWGVMTLMGAAGAVIGFSQLRGSRGSATARFVFVLVPVAVVTGWVLLASQPQRNWVRDHVRAWSEDLGIDGVVDNLDNHVAVVAFGLGVIFGVRFDLRLLRRRRRAVEATSAAGTVRAPASSSPPGASPPPAGGETTVEQPAPPHGGT